MKRALPLLAVVLALALAGCFPPKPRTSPPTPPQGFDACAAPSSATMQNWWTFSPFTSIGVYVGGANRGCAQPNLTARWISLVEEYGWKLLPLWVGPQAPCTALSSVTKLPATESAAFTAGYNEGLAAATRLSSLGFGWLTPVYYDLEAYPKNAACTKAILAFDNGWTRGLNTRGYLAGLYSSLCSGIVDSAAGYPTATYKLNAIWIAAWNNTPNIFGFNTSTCPLSDSLWANHQRVHQFKGGHNETWGGVTINIDSNAVDGPTHPL
ncbi:MAG: DUF1906 domain-containing protein [Acidimicrobiia bacterium]